MTSFEITLLVSQILLVVLIFAFIFLSTRKSRTDMDQDHHLLELRSQVENIQKELKLSLDKNIDFLQKQSNHSTQIIQQVTSKLEQIDATNKQVVGFASQLQSLENILKNPKQRGILGEYFLETILSNVLPPSNYKLQYAFKNHEIVDAVIFVRDKIIPIDAKFSLENYNRIQEEQDRDKRKSLEADFKQDVKKRIDETSKYIRPDEGTMDFALMFVPAEGVFYNLLVSSVGVVDVSSQNLIEYANKKRVIIVSPTTFVAYLQTILQALKALQVEQNIKDILKGLQQLNKHYLNFDNYLQKLGTQFGTTVNTYNTAYKEFSKINKDMNKLIGTSHDIEPLQLDKPGNLE